MHFSTALTMALAAFPLAFAGTMDEVRMVAEFWHEPYFNNEIGYITEPNLDRCVTVTRGDQEIGSAKVHQYDDRSFYCNLYRDIGCTGDWVTQITGEDPNLPGDGKFVRSAKCYSFNI